MTNTDSELDGRQALGAAVGVGDGVDVGDGVELTAGLGVGVVVGITVLDAVGRGVVVAVAVAASTGQEPQGSQPVIIVRLKPIAIVPTKASKADFI